MEPVKCVANVLARLFCISPNTNYCRSYNCNYYTATESWVVDNEGVHVFSQALPLSSEVLLPNVAMSFLKAFLWKPPPECHDRLEMRKCGVHLRASCASGRTCIAVHQVKSFWRAPLKSDVGYDITNIFPHPDRYPGCIVSIRFFRVGSFAIVHCLSRFMRACSKQKIDQGDKTNAAVLPLCNRVRHCYCQHQNFKIPVCSHILLLSSS